MMKRPHCWAHNVTLVSLSLALMNHLRLQKGLLMFQEFENTHAGLTVKDVKSKIPRRVDKDLNG